MSKPKQRIYTQADWEAADALDRLYMHLMEPERWVLNAYEEDKLDNLNQVWKIIVKKASPRERIRIITHTLNCCDRSAFRYIQDATKLFMETLDLDHDLELRLAYHRFSRLHDEARKAEDWDSARRALDSAMNIRAQIEARQPKQLRMYASLIFTDDPKALTARNSDHTDIEFEDLSHAEEGLLELKAVEFSKGN